MLKKIYSADGEIEDDVKQIILKNKDYSLKELLYKYAIPEARIGWKGQKKTFKVIARNDNFIIIVRPYNPKKTFEYSILDLKHMECNHDNYYTKYDYSNKEECEIALRELQETRDEFYKTHIMSVDGLQLSSRGPAKIDDVITEIYINVKVN